MEESDNKSRVSMQPTIGSGSIQDNIRSQAETDALLQKEFEAVEAKRKVAENVAPFDGYTAQVCLATSTSYAHCVPDNTPTVSRVWYSRMRCRIVSLLQTHNFYELRVSLSRQYLVHWYPFSPVRLECSPSNNPPSLYLSFCVLRPRLTKFSKLRLCENTCGCSVLVFLSCAMTQFFCQTC